MRRVGRARSYLLAVCGTAVLIAGIGPTVTANAAARSGSPGLCTGIRGNGDRIFSHFGALARIVEQYGPVRCSAGGSSGSITTFLIDSVDRNPAVSRCGRARCRPAQVAEREALLYKSMSGLTDVGIGADVRTVIALVDRIRSEGIGAKLGTDPAAAVQAFGAVLDDFGDAINPQVELLLAQSPDPAYHVQDIISGLQDALAFKAASPMVFVRPSLLNWKVVVRLLGRVGDFYAGYGPAHDARLRRWLDACAERSRGLTWTQAKRLHTASGSCGSRFAYLYDRYERAYRAHPPARSRLDDRIGDRLPMFAVTGMLANETPAWKAARAQYAAAQPVTFTPSFSDVRFGYYGRTSDLRRIKQGLARMFPTDVVTERFRSLGPATWRTILSTSPAEPGLSAAVPLRNVLTVGGWADPLRVQTLKAFGARDVITIIKRGVDEPGGFTYEVPHILGATDAELARLYSLTDPTSAESVGLTVADGVWCTNWDNMPAGDTAAQFDDAYNAPMRTDDPRLLRGYRHAARDVPFIGCQLGATTD